MESRQLDHNRELDELRWGGWGDWMQLVRLPNVFTLLSNCIAACVISVGTLGKLGSVLPLFAASALAYWAGLILNDVNDLNEDRQHRPDRPLPSGRISPALAGHVATGMLVASTAIVAIVGAYGDTLWLAAALGCSVLLWIAIRLYNSSLKLTLLGPVLMGCCRGLNILMVGFGMLCVYWGQPFSTVQEFPDVLIAYATGISLYICGITVYARREEQASNQGTLFLGSVLELVGLAVIGCLPLWTVGRPLAWQLPANSAYPVLIGLIGLTILNRAVGGVFHPVPRKVQLAVKHAILSIIVIDAAVVLMFAGRSYGIATVLLLLPAVVGAMKLRTT